MLISTINQSVSILNSFYLNSILILIIISLATYRSFISDRSDPYHCKSLLQTGHWLDEPENRNWQPRSCMLNQRINPSTISKNCLKDRQVVFIGDSITRLLYYSTINVLDSSAYKQIDQSSRHSDKFVKTDQNVSWDFIWDPFLNSTKWNQLVSKKFTTNRPNSTPSPSWNKDDYRNHQPALLVVGSGLWYLRNSLGTQPWKLKMDELFKSSLDHSNHTSIADEIVVLPVESPVIEKLSAVRKSTISPNDIEEMNEYSLKKLYSDPNYPIAIPTVFNLITNSSGSETKDGLHFSEDLNQVQSKILLNLRCNDQLPKKFPFGSTCCFRYPSPNLIQIFIIIISLLSPILLFLSKDSKLFSPSNFIAHNSNFKSFQEFAPKVENLRAISIFSISLILIFLSDRTSLFSKEQKHFDKFQFGALNIFSLLIGLITIKESEKGDLGFLNRDQTDEWKGWMQIAILIYHYLGASKISGIYNPIRICVASYLFMTGYGHFTFYYLKKDFGLGRILGVLVRLNLLTIILSYLMDTDYLSYYFSPLVTMWFLIIWLTMFLGNRYNDRTIFMAFKLIVSASLMTILFYGEEPLRSIFRISNSIFFTNWSFKEWSFRVKLDLYIVYFGMICSLIYLKLKESFKSNSSSSFNGTKGFFEQFQKLQKLSIPISVLGLVWFFWFELSRSNKLEYNRYHPFISIIPIGSFVVLRNSTTYLRSINSSFFCYFGKCSLETFIIQFHFWLAGDTKGILKMIEVENRLINFIVNTLVFVFLSNEVSKSTGTITSLLCFKPKPKTPSNTAMSMMSTSTNGNNDLDRNPSRNQGGRGGGEGGSDYVPIAMEEINQDQKGLSPLIANNNNLGTVNNNHNHDHNNENEERPTNEEYDGVGEGENDYMIVRGRRMIRKESKNNRLMKAFRRIVVEKFFKTVYLNSFKVRLMVWMFLIWILNVLDFSFRGYGTKFIGEYGYGDEESFWDEVHLLPTH